jgi:hypothetical protein
MTARAWRAAPNAVVADPAEAVRRLDWRFLLRDPRLRRVMYVGAGAGLLLPALMRFGAAVTRYPSAAAALHGADLVVAQAVRLDAVKGALALLAPDGLLYWELEPHHNPFRCDWAGVHALGVEDVRLHWHYPNFEDCRWIVPIADPNSAAALVRWRWQTMPSPAGALLSVCRRLTRLQPAWQLLPVRQPSFSLTGRYRRGAARSAA